MTPKEIDRLLEKAHEETPRKDNRWETLTIYALGFVLGFAASGLATWVLR